IRDFHVTGVQTCALPISTQLGPATTSTAGGGGGGGSSSSATAAPAASTGPRANAAPSSILEAFMVFLSSFDLGSPTARERVAVLLTLPGPAPLQSRFRRTAPAPRVAGPPGDTHHRRSGDADRRPAQPRDDLPRHRDRRDFPARARSAQLCSSPLSRRMSVVYSWPKAARTADQLSGSARRRGGSRRPPPCRRPRRR